MDRNNKFVYIYDIMRVFLDPGLWPLHCDYAVLNNVPNRWNYASLMAPFWRVFWNNKAGAAIRLGKQIIPILPDKLYIITPNVDIGSTHRGNCRQLYIHFQIRHPYVLRGPPIITLPMTGERRYFTRRIIAGYNGAETVQQQTALLIRAFLATLIGDLMDQYLVFRRIEPRLMNALNYLAEHMGQSIDNRNLAAMMHVHLQTMLRLFKNELGKSPQAYLRQMRIDKACWLLCSSDESIKTIAELTGFCDRYHFTKVFTALTGQSPARFRDNK